MTKQYFSVNDEAVLAILLRASPVERGGDAGGCGCFELGVSLIVI